MKPRFTSRAHQDVDEAMGYYCKINRQLAADFHTAVDAAAQAIQSRPMACPRASTELRRYMMSHFPYGIFYQVRPMDIVVVAVIHAKRDPRVWRARE